MFGGRFLLTLNTGYSILEFGEEQIPGLTTQRVGRLDGHLDANVGVSYFFIDWLSLGIVNKTDWRVTNAEAPPSNGVGPENLGYIRNQTFVLASLSY